MRPGRRLAVLAAAMAVSVVLPASPAPAVRIPKPTADYNFSGNVKSSVGTVPRLVKVNGGFSFERRRVLGTKDRVLRWPAGSGLTLNKAHRAVGADPRTYTIVMVVRLNAVDDYRKLVHLQDLTEDHGFYVQEGEIYVYTGGGSEPVIAVGKWYQIAFTRDASGIIRCYVGKKKVFQVDDPSELHVVESNNFLRFLMDDESTQDEETGGRIARLRIWSKALTTRQVKALDTV